MDDWKAIMLSAGALLTGGAGIKLADLFLKRGTDVAKVSIREGTKRTIAKVELTGSAQEQVAKMAEWALNEFNTLQDEHGDLKGKIASLETANNALRSSFDKIKIERDRALIDNAEFVKQVASLIEQAKDLSKRLAEANLALARLSLEHEGAKERVFQQEKLIAEMTAFIHQAGQREAELEAALERARTV